MTALPITENPAVQNPMKVMTRTERDALLSIDFYRRQKRIGTAWHIGPKRFGDNTVASLERRNLIRRGERTPLVITQAGYLVILKLKELGA